LKSNKYPQSLIRSLIYITNIFRNIKQVLKSYKLKWNLIINEELSALKALNYFYQFPLFWGQIKNGLAEVEIEFRYLFIDPQMPFPRSAYSAHYS